MPTAGLHNGRTLLDFTQYSTLGVFFSLLLVSFSLFLPLPPKTGLGNQTTRSPTPGSYLAVLNTREEARLWPVIRDSDMSQCQLALP